MKNTLFIEQALKLIQQSLEKKEFLKAAKLYELLVKQEPDNELFLFRCANLFAYIKEHERALSYYLNLAEISPKFPNILLLIADTYLQLNQFDNAILYYQRIIKKSKDDIEIAEACYKKGKILGAFKQLPEAEECFYQTLTLNPAHQKAHIALSFLNSIKREQDIAKKSMHIPSDPNDNNSQENKSLFDAKP